MSFFELHITFQATYIRRKDHGYLIHHLLNIFFPSSQHLTRPTNPLSLNTQVSNTKKSNIVLMDEASFNKLNKYEVRLRYLSPVMKKPHANFLLDGRPILYYRVFEQSDSNKEVVATCLHVQQLDIEENPQSRHITVKTHHMIPHADYMCWAKLPNNIGWPSWCRMRAEGPVAGLLMLMGKADWAEDDDSVNRWNAQVRRNQAIRISNRGHQYVEEQLKLGRWNAEVERNEGAQIGNQRVPYAEEAQISNQRDPYAEGAQKLARIENWLDSVEHGLWELKTNDEDNNENEKAEEKTESSSSNPYRTNVSDEVKALHLQNQN